MKKVYNKIVIFYSVMNLEYILTTNFVEVTVLPIYIEEQSVPHENCYVWMYNVKIKNKSPSTIQLLNRYWQIIDHEGKVNEVAGVGVIGEQPIIRSGEVFRYTSGTYLSVPSGVMQGKYEFLNEESTKIFEVAIPAFSLDSPYTDIKLH